MLCCWRTLLSYVLVFGCAISGFSQIQDKEQSKAMVELAAEMLKASQAEDDVRDIMVQAADLDTTNISANFEAGRLHLRTIRKDQAAKYLLRIYRQRPNFRFDLEYHIGSSFQFGLQFDKAIDFYNRYKLKYQRQPGYQGKDKVSLTTIERRIYECNNGKELVANPKPYAIVNIGPQINSEANDYAPVLNEKEDHIIFTSRRRDGNLNENVYSDNKPFEDVFTSTKIGGKWTKAVNIGRTVNIPNHNSNLALSPDGKTLFSYRDDNGGDIFVSELKADNSWSTPKPLPGIINSPYYESSVSISPDGNTLYFASERPGGQGSLDLYVCTKDSRGAWSKVRNLGPTINTERHEDGPFIDYSGKKLYFSSESHKGMGGYDIFETTLVNPAKNEWSPPVNVGYPINTADNDIYFVGTSDGKRGYYASVREDGLGYLDIYAIGPKELVTRPTTVLPMRLVVKVIDAKNNTPLEANIELLSLSDSKPVPLSAKTKGNYTFTVTTKDPKNYRLSVLHEGYFPQVEEITLQSADMVEKVVSRTVGMAKSDKAPVIIPLKYVVKVLDAASKVPLEALVKLQSTPDNIAIASTPKGGGTFEFSIITPTAKTYQLSVTQSGYTAHSETVSIEGAGTVAKTLTKTINLVEVKKAPVAVPVKYVVKVVDAKTSLPIEGIVKMEGVPDNAALVPVAKGPGTYEFELTSPTAKDYKLSVVKEGYLNQTLPVKIEGTATVEKIISKTISLAEVKKEVAIVPLKLSVKVVDEKTNLPLDANLKLEAAGEALKSGTTLKSSGLFDFAIASTASKEYTITAERDGYVVKSEKFTLEAAGATGKTISRTVALAEIVKEVVPVLLKFTVKVVDEKTNLPLEAKLKLEAAGEALKSGTTLKSSGLFDFAIASTTSKEYTLTAEREGYVLKSEKFMVEGAATTAKVVSKTITLLPNSKETTRPTAAVKLVVTVLDKKTNLPIEANVVLQSAVDNNKVEGVAKSNGVYEFSVTSAKANNYKISADREGYVYLAQQIKIEAATDQPKTVSRTLSLQPIAIGATSVLRNLFFDVGKATIKPESYPELNGFENMMKQNPTIRVEISGHTDDVGDNAFNKNLSQLRANAVKTFLVSKGINPKRLVSIGYGETRPLVSNDDESGGREINRRVELKILSK
jgi:outer membrane protein OmpA-like peptidoglycan-associated protein